MSMASRVIISAFFEEQWTQNHPQYLSGLSRALSPTTFLLGLRNQIFNQGSFCVCVGGGGGWGWQVIWRIVRTSEKNPGYAPVWLNAKKNIYINSWYVYTGAPNDCFL